jgi:hypothetical protein
LEKPEFIKHNQCGWRIWHENDTFPLLIWNIDYLYQKSGSFDPVQDELFL